MTSGVISVTSPMRVTVRDSSRTERYASLRRTSGSRSGSISSRAVASRIAPSRWTPPSSSRSPRGSVKGISVRMDVQRPPSAPRLLDRAREAALAVELRLRVVDRDRLRQDVRAAGREARGLVRGRVRGLEQPGLHRVALGVARHQRDVLDRARARALLRDLGDPVVELALLVDAAAERD